MLRRGLAQAVGDRFKVLEGKEVLDPDGRRHWLATLRAERDGEFLLRCKLSRSDAPASLPPIPDRVVEFPLIVGTVGSPRTVVQLASGTRTFPIACVGDTLVVPIPSEPEWTGHWFEMPAVLGEEEQKTLRLARANDELVLGEARGAVLVGCDNQAADVLLANAVVKASPPQGGSLASGWSVLSYVGKFDVAAPGKFLLEVRHAVPGGGAPAQAPAEQPRMADSTEGSRVPQARAVDISPKGQPIAVPMSQWVHRLAGHTGVAVAPGVLTLRVGDRLVLDCGSYLVQDQGRPLKPPPLVILKKPFEPPGESYRPLPPGS